jgi:hypothetical protein
MRHVRSLTLLAALGLTGSAAAQSAPAVSSGKATAAAITAADVHARVAFLASDALKGRDTPSPGLEQAAQYIAQEFKTFGLRPAGDSGTFIQRWPFERRLLTAEGARVVLGRNPLIYQQDFFIIPGPQDSVSGAVMYAGQASAQTAALPASAKGQILVFYIPGDRAEGPWVQAVQSLLPAALAAQPQAVVLLLDPEFPADQVASLAISTAGSDALPVMLVGVRYDAAKAWFAAAGAQLDTVRARAAPDAAPMSNLTITMVARPQSSAARPPNVVGILPGSDPVLKDTYIVFSAHMDHVGVGPANAQGDSIYNGADDDASGTSAVIEVAQAFAALPVDQRPRRSLVFLLVSGEEKGLFGSRYFVDHPPAPIDRIVANINIDMIGRNHPDTVVAIGQEYSSLGPLAQQAAKAHPNLKLTVAPDLWPQEQLFVRSDHFSFAVKNVPAIFFTTGLHADYHQPSDEVQTLDTDKVARIAQLVYQLGLAVATSPQVPEWTEAGKAIIRRASGNE